MNTRKCHSVSPLVKTGRNGLGKKIKYNLKYWNLHKYLTLNVHVSSHHDHTEYGSCSERLVERILFNSDSL